jgi:hypothetical protein
MDGAQYVVADARNTLFQQRLKAFLSAVNKHFDTSHPLTLIDLRGFGLWGEWHSGFRYPDLKSRRDALKSIIDTWSQALPGHILALSYSYDPDGPKAFYAGPNDRFDQRFTTNYTDFLHYSGFDYALHRKNITFRRDGCGGAVHSNERRLNEESFSKYKRAPFFGEFLGGYAACKKGGTNWVAWMIEDALSLHPNYLNLLGWQAEDARNFIHERPDLVLKGSLQMGYRFVPTQIEYPSALPNNASFELSSTWLNRGVGRALRNYHLQFFLIAADNSKIPEIPDSAGHELPTASWINGKSYVLKHRLRFPRLPAAAYQLALSMSDPKTGRAITLPLHHENNDAVYPIGRIEVSD